MRGAGYRVSGSLDLSGDPELTEPSRGGHRGVPHQREPRGTDSGDYGWRCTVAVWEVLTCR